MSSKFTLVAAILDLAVGIVLAVQNDWLSNVAFALAAYDLCLFIHYPSPKTKEVEHVGEDDFPRNAPQERFWR